MLIYIASSWRNQHGVEMLTALLRKRDYEVVSWIENNYGESHTTNFETWVNTPKADQSFHFDTQGATTCDLFIYYAPAGQDAAAELGAAWASKVPIVGLWAKGENLGLMRKMVAKWFTSTNEMMNAIDDYRRYCNFKLREEHSQQIECPSCALEYVFCTTWSYYHTCGKTIAKYTEQELENMELAIAWAKPDIAKQDEKYDHL